MLGRMVTVFCHLGNCRLVITVAAPVYIPVSSVREFQFLTSSPAWADIVRPFIMAILYSKGLYAQGSNTKNYSGISLVALAGHVLAEGLVSPLQVPALSPAFPLSFQRTERVPQ